jgi:hypothetical protein
MLHSPPRAGHRAALPLLLAALAACDIPTSAPKWETTWGLRAKTDSVTLAQLLPNDITIANGAFRTQPPSARASIRLADACGGVCAPVMLPKPAFTTTVATSITIAGDVARATLSSGNTVRATIYHDFGFDLLSPTGSAGSGSLALRILTRTTPTAAWDTVGLSVVSGPAASLPSGQSTAFDLPLIGNKTVGRELQLQATINSPAGGAVQLDGSRSLTVSLDAPRGISIATAAISLTPRTVQGDGADLDLSELDLDADHLRSATLGLTIDNPLAITGDASLVISSPRGITITKPFGFVSGSSKADIQFTSDELQTLRGAVSSLGIRATVRASASSGEVIVRPTDRIKIESTFIATIRPTGSPSGSH